jgi:hypothetical protein
MLRLSSLDLAIVSVFGVWGYLLVCELTIRDHGVATSGR